MEHGMTNEELARCPFCGGAATVENFPGEGEWTARCKNSSCWATISCHNTKAGATAAWSNRPTPTVDDAMVERAARALALRACHPDRLNQSRIDACKYAARAALTAALTKDTP